MNDEFEAYEIYFKLSKPCDIKTNVNSNEVRLHVDGKKLVGFHICVNEPDQKKVELIATRKANSLGNIIVVKSHLNTRIFLKGVELIRKDGSRHITTLYNFPYLHTRNLDLDFSQPEIGELLNDETDMAIYYHASNAILSHIENNFIESIKSFAQILEIL